MRSPKCLRQRTTISVSNEHITRRAVLASSVAPFLAGAQPPKPARTPEARGEVTVFLDPLTDSPVSRLTSRTSAAELPAAGNHYISARDRFLVFSSDRAGGFAPYRFDLHTGIATPLCEAASLQRASLTLDTSERNLLFLDGHALRTCSLSTKHARTLLDGVDNFSLAAHANATAVIRNGKLQDVAGNLLASDVEPHLCLVSPNGSTCAFARKSDGESQLWTVALAGESSPKRLSGGGFSNPIWSSDSQSLFVLQATESDPGNSLVIQQLNLVGGPAQTISAPAPLACFAPNRSDTVFVGASRSKAQPVVELLLRHPERELVLCEHRDSTPSAVRPTFSPDSKRIYFQSDREGKSVIYSVNTETLVEGT